MRKNQAFLFATFTVLLAFIFVMIAVMGFRVGIIINGFFDGRVFSFNAFTAHPKYYIPLSVSVASINLGVALSILPMLCAVVFLIVSLFKKKFVYGAYAAIGIALVALSLGYVGFLISNLVGIILNDIVYVQHIFDYVLNGSINFEMVYAFISNAIAYFATPILHVSILWN